MGKTGKDLSARWKKELGRRGYRITKPRRTIMDIIAESRRPLSPLEIFHQARGKSGGISLVTVYRTIERLESMGLVDRVHHSDQCQTVFQATAGHKHLLVCINCGQSVYFDGLDMEKQFLERGSDFGYLITGHWLQLNGLCPDCQKKKKNESANL